MRGKEVSTCGQAGPVGITPAYAGKSTGKSSTLALNWDHPRVCGEKLLSLGVNLTRLGSPLRMRGKDSQFRITRSWWTITPAYAGKRRCKAASVWLFRDHPRVCGEKPAVCSAVARQWGSPPRMRGKANIAIFRPWSMQDHPRVCGEKKYKTIKGKPTTGSPPRMRGKEDK